MLILGIDPGLQKTGWGILHSEGHALKFVACGLIRTDSTHDLGQRLAGIHRGLAAIIERWNPQTAAIEETFVNSNAASALKLGQARGAAMAVTALLGLDVAEYAANKIKKSLTGTGHADKQQVAMMIQTLLPKATTETGGRIGPDEADALAVAVCHAHYGQWKSALKRVRG